MRPVPGAAIPRPGPRPARQVRPSVVAQVLGALGARTLGRTFGQAFGRPFGFDTSWIGPTIEASSELVKTGVETAREAKAAKAARAAEAAEAKAAARATRGARQAPRVSSTSPVWAIPAALAGGAIILALVFTRPRPAAPIQNPRRRRGKR